MIRNCHWMLLALSTALVTACGRSAAPELKPTAEPPSQVAQLGILVQRYWDESQSNCPWCPWGASELTFGALPGGNISAQSLADSLAIERRYLAASSGVDAATLDPDSKLTYDLFVRERTLAIEGFTYPFELLPINPYAGMPQQFALMAPAAEQLALTSPQEFDAWRARSDTFLAWMTQATANLKEGMRRGYALPRVLVEKMLPELADLGEDKPANVFYQALSANEGTQDSAERSRQRAALTAYIHDKLLPSYRSLHDFLQREYLPRSRSTVALSALPLGEAWYGYLVRRAAGPQADAKQLHAQGVAEVERLHRRMLALLAETPSAGDPTAFALQIRRDPRYSLGSAAALAGAYQELKNQVSATAPTLFAKFPTADFSMRTVEAFRAPVSPALSYLPRASNGIASAALYVNTARLESQPVTDAASLFLREAIPGRHLQRELQFENAGLPAFRRYGTLPAFADGWALYAVSLGEELGAYRDAESKFGALLAQMRCAAGLVIDTGVHSQGLTRKQAIDYLHSLMPIEDALAEEAVDRIIALPGDALACTLGFLEVQGLRAWAQQKMGSHFDVHAFHAAVLEGGALPLDLLDSSIKAWANDVLTRPPPPPPPVAPADSADDAASAAGAAAPGAGDRR